jgi:hypothetical protein
MSEPTVLDYVKEKIRFWEQGTLHIPTLEEIQVELPEEPVEALPTPARPQFALPAIHLEGVNIKAIPWRSFAAFGFALVGQFMNEPPRRDRMVTVGLYLIGFAFLIWSLIGKEWKFAELPENDDSEDSFVFKWQYAVACIPFSILTYITFSGGVFTSLNMILWFLAIASILIAFWVLRMPVKERLASWGRWLTTWPKHMNISVWSLLVLAALAISIYFRLFHLKQVPPEMTSDHLEKLLDVQDVMNGIHSVFFIRNTGREAIQFYLTALIIKVFHTGISFLSLKIGTAAAGIAILPYIYLTGKELGSKRVGLLAMFLCGVAYWPNVISRVGLRFPLYPLFVAPAMYYLLRGLRTKNRNDMILSGIALGMGMHGYSTFRVVPLLIIVGVLIYLLSTRNTENRKFAFNGLVIIALVSFVIFLPLFRYSIDHPDMFYYRTLTRVGTLEAPYPDNPVKIFFSNTWNAMLMFGNEDGNTWLHSILFRPALDYITGALFYLGFIGITYRFFTRRKWQDLFLLLSVPLLLLPSILSLSFPIENPSLNRTAAAIIPAFLLVAMALDGLMTAIETSSQSRAGRVASIVLCGVILVWSARNNYSLVFDKYLTQYQESAGNTTEMGEIIRQFADTVGTPDTAWIVGYPFWVDTRLPSIVAGYPIRDYAIWPQDFATTLNADGPKLFILNQQDTEDLQTLQQLYPTASVSLHHAIMPKWDFLIMMVPAKQ